MKKSKKQKNKRDRMDPDQAFILSKRNQMDPKLKVRWDDEIGAPALMSGKIAEPYHGVTKKVAVQAAKEFLEENKSLFRMDNPTKDLSLIKKVTDSKGNTAVAMQQTYNGIPVNGGTVRVQFGPDKTVQRVANKYQPDIDIETKPKITSKNAEKLALEDPDSKGGELEKGFKPHLSIFKHKGKYHLVWNIRIEIPKKQLLYHYYIDAKDGEILFKYNDYRNYPAVTCQGNGYYSGSGDIPTFKDVNVYKLIDINRKSAGGPEIRICNLAGTNDEATDDNISENPNEIWNKTSLDPRRDHQGPEIDVLRYLGETIDHYKNILNWNSFDNYGTDVYAGVHMGNNVNQAKYSKYQNKLYFGDGDGKEFDYLTPKDVVAHEFTHAVTHHTSNLNYYNQAGGLNEAFSDIFAIFIDSDNTDIGEDCTTPSFPGDCLRRMNNVSDPGAYERIPNHVLEDLDSMYTGYFDGQDPHEACGPINYATYFMLHGGTHPNSKISTDVIGYTKTEQIMWHVQTIGLLGNSNATFLECREAALNAVDALYQTDPDYLKILNSVKNAFTAVGIGPDIFIRDNLNDVGTVPSLDTFDKSPDIIIRQIKVRNPDITFRDMNRDDFSQQIVTGQDNFIYIRLQNRGSVTGDVRINVYWTSPSTYAVPSSWNYINSVDVLDIQPGLVKVIELIWDAMNIPTSEDISLIVELDTPTDPAPDKSLITNGLMFNKFITESNNYACRNVKTVEISQDESTTMGFYIRGNSSDENLVINFDVQQLPVKTEITLKILRRFCEGAQMIGMQFVKADTRYAYYKLNPGEICYIRDVPFYDQDESIVNLIVNLPKDAQGSFEYSVSQYISGNPMGKVTQIVQIMSSDKYVGNKNSKEVHKNNCRFVKRMSEKNKVVFETLEKAHLQNYNNCDICIGE